MSIPSIKIRFLADLAFTFYCRIYEEKENENKIIATRDELIFLLKWLKCNIEEIEYCLNLFDSMVNF